MRGSRIRSFDGSLEGGSDGWLGDFCLPKLTWHLKIDPENCETNTSETHLFSAISSGPHVTPCIVLVTRAHLGWKFGRFGTWKPSIFFVSTKALVYSTVADNPWDFLS